MFLIASLVVYIYIIYVQQQRKLDFCMGKRIDPMTAYSWDCCLWCFLWMHSVLQWELQLVGLPSAANCCNEENKRQTRNIWHPFTYVWSLWISMAEQRATLVQENLRSKDINKKRRTRRRLFPLFSISEEEMMWRKPRGNGALNSATEHRVQHAGRKDRKSRKQKDAILSILIIPLLLQSFATKYFTRIFLKLR